MNYPLKEGQTAGDVLFWMVSVARERFPEAALYMEGELIGNQRLSLGLDDGMYARFCPLNEPLDLLLERGNGDAISYSADFPRVLRVTGLDSFVNEVMQIPPPEPHLQLFYGDMRTRGRFQMNAAFQDLSAADQLRCCLKITGETETIMLVSSEENGGKAVPAATSTMLPECKELIDIVLRKDSDTWILFHFATDTIYTSGFRLTEAKRLLNQMIME